VNSNNRARGFLGGALWLFALPPALAGSIMGSVHDFTIYNWSQDSVCVACHNPGTFGGTNWNHAMSAATYTMYGSNSMKASVGKEPGPLSKLCLSCHDGTVAVDSFGGTAGSQYISSPNNIGTNLQNDHPIGFVYDTALAAANKTLYDPSLKTVTIGSGATTLTGTISSTILYSGLVECSTCHDVHNKFTVVEPGLLKVTATGSAICMTCHNK
jgi:predicted CXXCH cytochrome family protein